MNDFTRGYMRGYKDAQKEALSAERDNLKDLLTTPRQRKPWVSLSDEEIIECAADFIGDANSLLVIYFVREIEDKLKAKNERKEKNT